MEHSLAPNSFIPLFLQPTRITSHPNTLVNNIFEGFQNENFPCEDTPVGQPGKVE